MKGRTSQTNSKSWIVRMMTMVLLIWMLMPLADVAAERTTGTASYYSSRFNGRRTSSGEVLDNDLFTAAHGSDLTIGDFWGRKGVVDDDDTGISLMIVNSEKGKAIVDGIRKDPGLYLKELDKSQYEYAYKRNQVEYSLERRDQMVKAVQKIGFAGAVNQRYARRINLYRVKRTIKKLIGYQSCLIAAMLICTDRRK